VHGSDPFLRVCLGSSVRTQPIPGWRHVPRTNVPAAQDLRPDGTGQIAAAGSP